MATKVVGATLMLMSEKDTLLLTVKKEFIEEEAGLSWLRSLRVRRPGVSTEYRSSRLRLDRSGKGRRPTLRPRGRAEEEMESEWPGPAMRRPKRAGRPLESESMTQ